MPRRVPRCRSRIAGVAAAVMASACVGAVAGEPGPCGSDQDAWVSVTFSPEPWDPQLAQAVLADLDAGLRRRGIAACRASDVPKAVDGRGPCCIGSKRAAPLAAIQLELSTAESVLVTVEIHDALTNKSVARQLDWAPIPRDGRALALALAADELLWASWAELSLAKPARPREAPAPIAVELDRRWEPPLPQRARVSVGLGLEQYAGKLTLLGADVNYSRRISERLRAELGLGLRQGLETSAPDGQVTAVAVGFEAGLLVVLLRSNQFELAVTGSERTSYVRFQARANARAAAHNLAGLTLFARAGLQATVLFASPIWLGIGVGGGVPLRAMEATDQGRSVVGMSGIEGALNLKIGVAW